MKIKTLGEHDIVCAQTNYAKSIMSINNTSINIHMDMLISHDFFKSKPLKYTYCRNKNNSYFSVI